MLSPEEEARREHRLKLSREARKRWYARTKADPARMEAHRQACREEMAKCRERNLDAINARRRERYAEKRAQRLQQQAP